MKYENIKIRATTSFVLVLIITSAIVGGPYPLLALLLTINFLALTEYNKLSRLLGYRPQTATLQVMGPVLILMAWYIASGHLTPRIFLVLIPAPAIICSAELLRKTQSPFPNIGFTLLGLLWISLPLAAFSCMSYITGPDLAYCPQFYIGYFLLLWSGDSGAYLAGSMLGKHPLLSRVSPKKTIEGSAGGLLAAICIAIINAFLFHDLTLSQWIIIGLIVNITGTLGDLVKSMLKRSADVKDSGKLLPGHGGIIDRFDSMLGSAPFVFLYLTLYA